MILADTSIWIDHFRKGNERLTACLENDDICIHPFIIGEIACGRIEKRYETLTYFKSLRQAAVATHEEVILFIDIHNLPAMGIGYVDVHLLASAKLSGARMWTLDRRLKSAAQLLDMDFTE